MKKLFLLMLVCMFLLLFSVSVGFSESPRIECEKFSIEIPKGFYETEVLGYV